MAGIDGFGCVTCQGDGVCRLEERDNLVTYSTVTLVRCLPGPNICPGTYFFPGPTRVLPRAFYSYIKGLETHEIDDRRVGLFILGQYSYEAEESSPRMTIYPSFSPLPSLRGRRRY
jgi:hypothetical protein